MKERKLVCGVGINDADYYVVKREKVDGKWITIWKCPYYSKWEGMLTRCYSKKYQLTHPTYKGCIVCEEWLYFSNFREWMRTQDWEDRQLDKDFLIEGNKVYSPLTCVFLPQELNNFTNINKASRGDYTLGVSYSDIKDKRVNNESHRYCKCIIKDLHGNSVHLGYYSTPQEAHQIYLKVKLEQCNMYTEEFKNEYLLVKGLTRVKDKIQYHIDNNLELQSF